MKKYLVLSLIVLLGVLIAGQTWAMSKKPSKEEQIRLVVQPMLDTLSTGITTSIRKEIATETQSLGDSLTDMIDGVAGRTSAVRGEVNLLGSRLTTVEDQSNKAQTAVVENASQIASLGLSVNQSLATQKEDLVAQLAAMNQAQVQKISVQNQEIEVLKVRLSKRSAWRIPRAMAELAIASVIVVHVMDHSGR